MIKNSFGNDSDNDFPEMTLRYISYTYLKTSYSYADLNGERAPITNDVNFPF